MGFVHIKDSDAIGSDFLGCCNIRVRLVESALEADFFFQTGLRYHLILDALARLGWEMVDEFTIHNVVPNSAMDAFNQDLRGLNSV